MKIQLSVLTGVILFLVGVPAALAEDFYVDSSALGSDENAGTSPARPWRTLEKVNGTRFSPGDRIRFKRGGAWKGFLSINDSGSGAAPILFGSYGDAATAKPWIEAEGRHIAAVLVEPGVSYCRIEGFRLSNCKDSIDSGPEAMLSGIQLSYSEILESTSIHLIGNEIFNIEGYSNTPGTIPRGASASGSNDHQYANAGIYVRSYATSNLLIEGNDIRDSTCAGIIVQTFGGEKGRGIGTELRHNSICNVGSDGIILINQDAPLIEYNSCIRAGNNSGKSRQVPPTLGSNGSAVVGMWARGCNSAIFQYNYCEGTRKIQHDGQAWDFDLDNKGTLIYQFNYSRDNEGGFLLSTGDEPGLVKICRYNISVNDGSKQNVDGQGFFNRHADYYNNVFYRDDGKGFEMASYAPLAVTGIFFNNVFYLGAPAAKDTIYQADGRRFKNNLFFGHRPASPGENPVVDDPRFVGAAALVKFKPGGYPFTKARFVEALAGFQAAQASPMIDRGVTISNPGAQDFWGNPLYQGTANIGVHEN